MKFCTKCGNQMTDDMVFCPKCGTKSLSDKDTSFIQNEGQDFLNPKYTPVGFERYNEEPLKLRTSMKIWMIICFVYCGVYAIISVVLDASMLAMACFSGVLGLMFYVLAKTPKGPVRVLSNSMFFEKTNGISKGAFVCISVFLAFLLFGFISINIADVNQGETNSSTVVNSVERNEETQEPEIPIEFLNECPISISASMYDNIIGFPELKCNIKNNSDKEILAVQLYFVPKNVYGEESDSIFSQNELQYDTPISANGTDTAVWQMLDQSVKSGDLYIYSVYFSDGTEWGNRNASKSEIKKHAMRMNVSY